MQNKERNMARNDTKNSKRIHTYSNNTLVSRSKRSVSDKEEKNKKDTKKCSKTGIITRATKRTETSVTKTVRNLPKTRKIDSGRNESPSTSPLILDARISKTNHFEPIKDKNLNKVLNCIDQGYQGNASLEISEGGNGPKEMLPPEEELNSGVQEGNTNGSTLHNGTSSVNDGPSISKGKKRKLPENSVLPSKSKRSEMSQDISSVKSSQKERSLRAKRLRTNAALPLDKTKAKKVNTTNRLKTKGNPQGTDNSNNIQSTETGDRNNSNIPKRRKCTEGSKNLLENSRKNTISTLPNQTSKRLPKEHLRNASKYIKPKLSLKQRENVKETKATASQKKGKKSVQRTVKAKRSTNKKTGSATRKNAKKTSAPRRQRKKSPGTKPKAKSVKSAPKKSQTGRKKTEPKQTQRKATKKSPKRKKASPKSNKKTEAKGKEKKACKKSALLNSRRKNANSAKIDAEKSSELQIQTYFSRLKQQNLPSDVIKDEDPNLDRQAIVIESSNPGIRTTISRQNQEKTQSDSPEGIKEVLDNEMCSEQSTRPQTMTYFSQSRNQNMLSVVPECSDTILNGQSSFTKSSDLEIQTHFSRSNHENTSSDSHVITDGILKNQYVQSARPQIKTYFSEERNQNMPIAVPQDSTELQIQTKFSELKDENIELDNSENTDEIMESQTPSSSGLKSENISLSNPMSGEILKSQVQSVQSPMELIETNSSDVTDQNMLNVRQDSTEPQRNFQGSQSSGLKNENIPSGGLRDTETVLDSQVQFIQTPEPEIKTAVRDQTIPPIVPQGSEIPQIQSYFSLIHQQNTESDITAVRDTEEALESQAWLEPTPDPCIQSSATELKECNMPFATSSHAEKNLDICEDSVNSFEDHKQNFSEVNHQNMVFSDAISEKQVYWSIQRDKQDSEEIMSESSLDTDSELNLSDFINEGSRVLVEMTKSFSNMIINKGLRFENKSEDDSSLLFEELDSDSLGSNSSPEELDEDFWYLPIISKENISQTRLRGVFSQNCGQSIIHSNNLEENTDSVEGHPTKEENWHIGTDALSEIQPKDLPFWLRYFYNNFNILIRR